MDRKKIYYVYEWYNMETNYIFYVGKGCKNRMLVRDASGRNNYFMRYYNKHNCDCRKIKENLTEKQALNYEHQRILELRKTNQCCCNLDDGGTNGGRNFGEKNGFYGKHHLLETIEKIKNANIGRFKGSKNPQYGNSPKNRMSKSKYKEWRHKHSIAFRGDKNNQYGISVKQRMKTTEKYNEFCKKCSRGSGSSNPNSKKIIMYKENFEIRFNSFIDCAYYILNNKISKGKLSTIQNNISTAVSKNKKYLNFNFKLQ